MKTINPALLAHLQGDVLTICTLWLITLTNGTQYGFTDLDQPVTYNGIVYASAGGYTHSSVESGSTLSTSNSEVNAIFDSSDITPADLESGLWDDATVAISLINYNNVAAGVVQLNGGTLGQVTLMNGKYTAELRGLAQIMQQDYGDIYSPTCRAQFGDNKCQLNLAPFTFSGSVVSVNSSNSWNDPTLTQAGATIGYIDTSGLTIPTASPFNIQVVPPTGGAFVSDNGVFDQLGNQWTAVGGSPGNDQYVVGAGGLYEFNGGDVAGQVVYINFDYTISYFAYGIVTWLTGKNAGTSSEVRTFSPGVVTLNLTPVFPIQAGDTYTIQAGCDRTSGTCKTRFNNLIHFRGEPYIPGQDTIIKIQS
jgi:hypothetical protein